MPIATVDPSEYQRYELTSAPPDGFITLRPLPFGMKLARRDKATKMMMRAATPGRGAKGRLSQSSRDETEIEFITANEWAIAYDFKYCIGDHNLTDAKGNKLDFGNAMVMKSLNPLIGSEIEELVNKLNEGEDEESIEDFLMRRTDSLEDGPPETDFGDGLEPENTDSLHKV